MTNADTDKYAIAVAVTLLMTARCGDNTKLGTIISDAEASGFTEAVGDAACTVRISPEKAAGCDMVWIHSTDTSSSPSMQGRGRTGLGNMLRTVDVLSSPWTRCACSMFGASSLRK